MGNQTAWSFSRLNNYETCPKKFWHTSVNKDIREAEGEAMRYGKLVHKALEKRVGKNVPLPANLAHLEKYAKRLADSDGEKLTEMQLAIDSSFNPCSWFGKQTWCRAILDLAIIKGTHAIVFDYKTGKISDDFTQLRLAGVMLMLHKLEIQTVDLGYLWTKDKKLTRDGTQLTRAGIKGVISDFMPRIKRYEEAHRKEEFPARPGFLCKKYCPVKKCPHNGE
ncbi:MAG: PD-(D/E)XK nuclease family protein [Nitrosomonadaceae bacterium]